MIEYKPQKFEEVPTVNVVSAWKGLETILNDIIVRFNISTNEALEFGVEAGYSTTALAHYFKHVIGVDKFYPKEGYTFLDVKKALKDWKNITLVAQSFEDYILIVDRRFDLIHIDIIHEYNPTFDCGNWACQHSNCVIFHDTESFPAMKKVCLDLAEKYNMEFYNYPLYNGLGILIKIV